MASSIESGRAPASAKRPAIASGNASVVQSTLEVDSFDPDDEWDWDARVSSITSSVLDYEYENGRRYHGYRAGAYPLPNDEKELDRLDIQYHVLTLAMSGELYLAPLDRPRRVLDIGTGTGMWAIEMAEAHPEANVLGVDLSPIQPDLVPENAHFEIDDIESPWMYKLNYFDFIHSRIMIGAIHDWKKLLSRSFNHLKPGGWIEFQELDPEITSDDGTHQLSPCNIQYNVKIVEASEKYGCPVPRHGEWKKMMEDAGFVDVRAHYFKVPIGVWPKDPRMKEVGKFQLLNYFEGYEAIGIGLFTRALGWTEPEFQVFLAQIRNELKDRNIHTYQYWTAVYGRKPPLPSDITSRQNTPSSTNSSIAGLSLGSNGHKIRPPVPPFPQSAKQNPSALAETTMADIAEAAESPAKPQIPDTPLGNSVPGSVTFRINRNGEVIRLHQGESLQQHTDTFYHFTIDPSKREAFSRQRFEKETQIDKPAVDISAIEKDSPADILDKMQITEDDESSKRNHVLTTSAVSA